MSLHDKAVDASKHYLLRKGYDLMDDPDNYFDICAYDVKEDCAALIKVFEDTDHMPECDLSRTFAEAAAPECIMLFHEYIENNFQVRFDTIGMHVMAKDKAFMKHHINCLGDGSKH